MSEKTYNITEAACLLGISRFTAYAWMDSGKLPYVWEGRAIKRRRIPEHVIHQLIENAQREVEKQENSPALSLAA